MMNDNGKTFRLKKGDVLFRQDDTSRDIHVIKTGEVLVFKSEDGMDVELGRCGPGAVVGEVSAIDGGTRSATVMALIDTETIRISFDEFSAIVKKLPDWFNKIAKILVKRLRDADARIESRKDDNGIARVAAFISLLTYTDKCIETPDGYTFSASVLENEIVDILGTRVDEADLALRELQKKKVLILEKGKIIAGDRSKLEELAKSIYETPESSHLNTV